MALVIGAIRAVIELEIDARGCLRHDPKWRLHRHQHRVDLLSMARVQNKFGQPLHRDPLASVGILVEDLSIFEVHALSV